MAIQIAYSTDNDDYPTAYARVVQVPNDYKNAQGVLVVQYYKSKAASNNGKRPVGSMDYDIRNGNFAQFFSVAAFAAGKTDPLKQGYLFLMTLPEFAGGAEV